MHDRRQRLYLPPLPPKLAFGERGGYASRLVKNLEPAASWLRAITPRGTRDMAQTDRGHRDRYSEHFMLTSPQPRNPMPSPKAHQRDVAGGATFFGAQAGSARAAPMAGGFKPAGRRGAGYTLRDEVSV